MAEELRKILLEENLKGSKILQHLAEEEEEEEKRRGEEARWTGVQEAGKRRQKWVDKTKAKVRG